MLAFYHITLVLLWRVDWKETRMVIMRLDGRPLIAVIPSPGIEGDNTGEIQGISGRNAL